jgi:hypothetical protein
MAGGTNRETIKNKAIAPPVYRPQTIPRVLQRKVDQKNSEAAPTGLNKKQAAAPSVFRPQPTARILQRKQTSVLGTTSMNPVKVAAVPMRNTVLSLPRSPQVRQPDRFRSLGSRVIQRANAVNAAPTFESHYLCEGGHVVTFTEDAIHDNHLGGRCPLRCNKMLFNLQADEDQVYYCINADCNQFHMSTNVSGNCLQCGKAKAHLSDTPAFVQVVADEQDASPADRRLKAEMQAAYSFIHSSGSHHKSTGGSHTAAAKQKHSKAHGSKKQVRQSYISQLTELKDADGVSPKLKAEAENLIKQVAAK